ncbi:MAG: di-trans,poly-cis-decaprenylcistransferase [Gemmatimonadetes bacterium]|nr:di-trans,poly-cis-decaprenylcistransferase [Gemmatimonadota bacterium]
MSQSTSLPTHVAIIMDGNGRWATNRGRPRFAGHRAGAAAVRRVVEAAPHLGITTLTLFAFSADNWKRPATEVNRLLRLFLGYVRAETATCVERGVRLTVIGRRDRLPPTLVEAVETAEHATAGGRTLHLRLAIDYSARHAIAQAAAAGTLESMEAVDLLIRTGGEKRLSDFLLWESAYAELYFTPVAWPEFSAASLAEALAEYRRRQRRFGGLPGLPGPRDEAAVAS